MENKTFDDILNLIVNNTSINEMEIIREKINNCLINHNYESVICEEFSSDFEPVCPHCHSSHIIKYGKDKHGNQRFYCKECHKSFSPMTNTLFSYSKKEPYQWYLYIDSLFHGDTLKESAEIAGICEYTAFVWRHKILSICVKLTADKPKLSGTVYLDEKLVDVNHIGELSNDDKKVKRGISNQKRNIACAIDEHGKKIIEVSEKGRIHTKELYRIFKDSIPSSCTVVSDSLRSYHKLMKDLNVTWIKIPSGKNEKDGYTLNKINLVHSSIELFLHKYRGISDKYLSNYMGLYKIKDQYKNIHNKRIFSKLYETLVTSSCELRYKHFSSEFSFSMI